MSSYPTDLSLARARRPSARVRGAAMAAASALGVMIGLGVRGASSSGWGTALARLAVVALRVRGLPEFVTPDRDGGVAAILGGAHIALVAAVWGAVIGAVTDQLTARRPTHRVAVVVFVAVAAALAGIDALLPAPLRIAAGTLARAEWGLMVIAVATAAAAGASTAP